MDNDKNIDLNDSPESSQMPAKKQKKHLIKNKWLRRSLKTLMGILFFIILIPVLLYIPPVQTFIKNIACDVVYNSTGMKVEIGRFRLAFPLDVALDDVTVLDQSKDTMVNAKEVIADVKLLPLLDLDVKLNRLRISNAYYRMVNADSSMIMSLRAGFLDVDNKSSANIAKSEIILNNAILKDGDVSLYMNVWKQKETPEDSTESTPFLIKAKNLKLENFSFAMSMLPTIDTLMLKSKDISLTNGVIDLRQNNVSWDIAAINDGSATYITPTPEWIAAHPAPESTSSSEPMKISGDSIALTSFKALYATKGVKPANGFDASYISVSDVNIGMRNFYNESSSISLPITQLQATERCGLKIVNGSGKIDVDSVGIAVDNLKINTVYSSIKASANVPFALMEMKPNAATTVVASAKIGLPDIDAFMPDLKQYTSIIPARNPITLDIDANGSLSKMNISKFNAALKEVLELKASGYAENPLDMNKLVAALKFSGELSDPTLINKFTGESGISVPAFTIDGDATANRNTYGADFTLTSTAGDVAAVGNVAINPETYNIDASVSQLNIAQFLPDLGVGKVSANIKADGTGFNPVSGKAVTNAEININGIEYNNNLLQDIRANVNLYPDGVFNIYAISTNPGLDFDIDGAGSIQPDDYQFDIQAHLRDVNLQTLGLADDMNCGSGNIYIKGSASPDRWLYDTDIKLSDFDWNLPDQYIHLPGGFNANLLADDFSTKFHVDSQLTNIDFDAQSGLKHLVDRFSSVSDIVFKQFKERNLAVDSISNLLPPFHLNMEASGKGLLKQVLSPYGMALDTVYANFSHDSLIYGNFKALRFRSESIDIDTLAMNIKERNNLLDYKIHMGNRPGTLDEFARVNLNGYLGANRLAASITQQNIEGKTGYRIGFTAALLDSLVSIHFTPLKSTIAYQPWTLNSDNYIEYGLYTNRVQAMLEAKSAESSIELHTDPLEEGGDELHAKIENLHIQDFLQLSMFAPPISGSLNSNLKVKYVNGQLSGNGTLGIKDFKYEKTTVGDFDLDLNAAYAANGKTDVTAAMKINGEPAIAAYANLRSDSIGFTPDSLGVRLTHFPLKVANPFLGNMLKLSGTLTGDMRMNGTFTKPLLNGAIALDSVAAYIPMAASSLKFEDNAVKVDNNVVKFDQIKVFGANSNPLTLDGIVDASSLSDISFNLAMNAQNFQVVGNDKRAKSDIYGKLFLNLDATVKGPMNHFDVKGNLNVLNTTDITYNLGTSPSELATQTDEDVVKFVNFNDTTTVAETDSLEQSVNMRVTANLTISSGAKATVLLSTNGTDRLEIQPSANLSYYQNFMGDMKLTGKLTTGNGFVRYNIPVIGDKMFTFDPESNVVWNGTVMNPTLNFKATDDVKASIASGSNSRLINFIVSLTASGTLDNPSIDFDLSTNDDASIQNELQSMSADQRQTQAMNLLLYGQYTSQSSKSSVSSSTIGSNLLYGFLESQINSWAAKTIRGVDLSFGIDQYNTSSNGSSSTQTSYSYQVSKSLFNNRFKINVGGNYSTDASADENLANNLVSDISVEYILKQTQSTDMSVKLFRHTDYESILEGEITETGVGFVMKRKLQNLFRIFRVNGKKRKASATTTSSATEVTDSIVNEAILPDEKNSNNEK